MAQLRTKVELYLGREFTHEEVFITKAYETDFKFKIVKWNIADEKAEPTDEQLDALEAEATKVENNKKAVRSRLNEYPSLGDIVDAIFKKEAGDSTEFDSLATKRQATKTKYAKE
jgi:hypothetical protein